MSNKEKQIKEQIKKGTYALDIETTAEKNVLLIFINKKAHKSLLPKFVFLSSDSAVIVVQFDLLSLDSPVTV